MLIITDRQGNSIRIGEEVRVDIKGTWRGHVLVEIVAPETEEIVMAKLQEEELHLEE